MSSATPVTHLLSIDDLSLAEIASILDRSRAYLTAGTSPHSTPFSTGLVFLSSSLRTRVGFASATTKLGGVPIDIAETRSGPEMSTDESLGDTLRTASGLVDVLVTRTVHPLGDLVNGVRCPIVNGGEAGGEHPTQALIDLLAIEEEKGAIEELSIGLCGDLSARTTRSLVKLFGRYQPKKLVLMGPPERQLSSDLLTHGLEEISRFETELVPEGLDVLYMVGLPPGGGEDQVPDMRRRRMVLDGSRLRRLPTDAVVLSPLPLIDEIAREVWSDRRIRIFEQSDRGVAVRMACLERVLGK